MAVRTHNFAEPVFEIPSSVTTGARGWAYNSAAAVFAVYVATKMSPCEKKSTPKKRTAQNH